MQATARLASSAASKRVIVGVSSTIPRSCYRASRGKAHAAPLSAQEPLPLKGQKRMSKQERRVMIEELVDKYRASNEGRFPTISYVRQQIGGSHYKVREILQELEYNHANPPKDNAKAAQGTTEFAKHSRSTNESKAVHAQETVQFAEPSWCKDDDGKNADYFEVLKTHQQDDVQHSLKDATAGTTTIDKAETVKSVGPVHIVEAEATKPDLSISDSVKNSDDQTKTESDSMMDLAAMEKEAAKPDFNISVSIKDADEPTLSDQTERDDMKDPTNVPATSLGLEARSDHGKQERETEVNNLDLNKTGNSLNASESTISDQSGNDKVIKGNMPHSEHGPKQELEESTEPGLLRSLKSFASGIKNFLKRL